MVCHLQPEAQNGVVLLDQQNNAASEAIKKPSYVCAVLVLQRARSESRRCVPHRIQGSRGHIDHAATELSFLHAL